MCLSDTSGEIFESFRHSGETQRYQDIEGTRVFNKTSLNYGQTVHKDMKENTPDVTTKMSDVTLPSAHNEQSEIKAVQVHLSRKERA